MISIIIPTYNEADQIAKTIAFIHQHDTTGDIEIIVADGGSADETFETATAAGAHVVISKSKGRAAQMNTGAASAGGDIIFFLHADSIPPPGFTKQILAAMKAGSVAGCFRLRFDYAHWFLKFNAWFTRFNVNAVRFGDQGLFIQRNIFEKCGRFREDLTVMEDQEIIHRIKNRGRFTVLKAAVTTSARKYHDNGIYRMQGIFFKIWALYYLGYSQDNIVKAYKKMIRKHKL